MRLQGQQHRLGASFLLLLSVVQAWSFLPTTSTKTFVQRQQSAASTCSRRHLSSSSSSSEPSPVETTVDVTKSSSEPIVFASGSSTQPGLTAALQEAVQQAVANLPKGTTKVDWALLSVSSLYDTSAAGGSAPAPTAIMPQLLEELQLQGVERVEHAMGSSVAGCIASQTSLRGTTTACSPTEYESVPAVSLTLAVLPDVQVSSFYVSQADVVPNDSINAWKRSVGLLNAPIDTNQPAVLIMIPSPAFATTLPDLLAGFSSFFPQAQIVGGLASTVSSLSRTRLWHWKAGSGTTTGTKGCVGIVLQGDVQLQAFLAQGAKPVGGIYQVLKAEESTMSVIVLDETATAALQDEEEREDEEEQDDQEENEEEMDAKQKMAAAYAKARIPKPVLAEANFLMRTLSDDDQAFMRRQLLVGLEQGGSVGRTASELARLAEGRGHRFTVHQVASAGMKDGSVTFALGSVDITPGTRMRFFVREPEFAKREVTALWTGYKKRVLEDQFDADAKPSFNPAACFVVPTLDRGAKFFATKSYESITVAETLPNVPCIAGFFSNGVVGSIDGSSDEAGGNTAGIQGSASGYFLIGSKSTSRPIYSPAAAAAQAAEEAEQQAAQAAQARVLAAEEAKREQRARNYGQDEKAPRLPNGELLLKRREVHSGRALTVSTVEWSVAEKTANPTSALEGYMWDKETEVDRFRERVPLANLVSQCRLSAADPAAPKPRDWVGPVLQDYRANGFCLIPDCKRVEPTTGSLRRRYDLPKLVRDLTNVASVLTVNCDGLLFGGSMEDISTARKASSLAAVEGATLSDDGVVVPPILASDLLLYPYQLYKLRLAGADAVTLLVGALASKDLKYLTKIAASLQLQTLVTVTSEVQIEALKEIPPGIGGMSGIIVSNRNLEDFSFDTTGEQALGLLQGSAMRELKELHGDDFPVLVEGRVGIIERPDPATGERSTSRYLAELKDAGAMGAFVGGGLVSSDGASDADVLQSLQSAVAS